MPISLKFQMLISEAEALLRKKHESGGAFMEKPVEVIEGDVTAKITLAMARNGAQGFYTTRCSFFKNGKRIAASEL